MQAELWNIFYPQQFCLSHFRKISIVDKDWLVFSVSSWPSITTLRTLPFFIYAEQGVGVLTLSWCVVLYRKPAFADTLHSIFGIVRFVYAHWSKLYILWSNVLGINWHYRQLFSITFSPPFVDIFEITDWFENLYR